MSENKVTITAEELEELKGKALKVEALEQTVAEKTSELEQKTTELATKEAAIAEKDGQLQAKDAEISTLTGEKTELEGKVQTLETKIAALEAEKQALVDQATAEAAKAHNDLVEKVIDLKVALNKPGVENREDAKTSHLARSDESLMDSYKDLVSEIKTGRPAGVQRVNNPAMNAFPEAGVQIEGAQKSEEELDAEKVLSYLFSGQFRNKKNK